MAYGKVTRATWTTSWLVDTLISVGSGTTRTGFRTIRLVSGFTGVDTISD